MYIICCKFYDKYWVNFFKDKIYSKEKAFDLFFKVIKILPNCSFRVYFVKRYYYYNEFNIKTYVDKYYVYKEYIGR